MDSRYTYDPLAEFADALEKDAAEMSGNMAAKFQELGPTAKGIAVDRIRAVTPRSPEITGHRGRLADSTIAVDSDASGYTGPELVSFDIEQPAKSSPNLDGSGGGHQYVQWLLPPGRGEITAPSDGPYSTGKKALAGPGFGPVKHVKAYEGNPYPLMARQPIATAYGQMLQRWGTQQLQSLFA